MVGKLSLTEEALPVAERSQRLSPHDREIRTLVRRLKGDSEALADFAAFTIDFDAPVPLGPETERELGKEADADEADAPILDLQILNIGGDE